MSRSDRRAELEEFERAVLAHGCEPARRGDSSGAKPGRRRRPGPRRPGQGAAGQAPVRGGHQPQGLAPQDPQEHVHQSLPAQRPRAQPCSTGPTPTPWRTAGSARRRCAALATRRARCSGPVLEREIVAALDTVPEEFRLVVVLADVEEMSYREIADIVGCPDRNGHVATAPWTSTPEDEAGRAGTIARAHRGGTDVGAKPAAAAAPGARRVSRQEERAMTCRQVATWIDAFIDGELSADETLEVEQHLATCELCSERVRFTSAFHTSIQRAVVADAVPSAGFEANLAGALRAERERILDTPAESIPSKRRSRDAWLARCCSPQRRRFRS